MLESHLQAIYKASMPKKKKNIKNCDALMALDKLKEWLPAITEILIKFVKCNRRQNLLVMSANKEEHHYN